MPVPSNRVPVRVARGTYANLNAQVASLAEGEVCYATDQDFLYVVEGGVLVSVKAPLGSSSLGDLTDVDLTGVATDDVIAYNGSSFVATTRLNNVSEDTAPTLGGDLDVGAFDIVSSTNANIRIAPDGTGEFRVMGNGSTAGKVGLACELNSHHVYLQSPPHSALATYTLVLPTAAGAQGEALSKGAGDQLEWVEYVPLATLKAETAAATDFADFQARIAAL